MSYNQEIHISNKVHFEIKREDLLHPKVSGNKYRKLKYNIAFAKAHSYKTILTFGGAYSNHIAATAAAGKLSGLKTIGVIRGEELADNLEKTLQENLTLAYAKSCGMQLHFVPREDYKRKEEMSYLDTLGSMYDNPYIIPEGGTNALAIKGCTEILEENDDFNYICCAAGTGGTVSGIIESLKPHQKALVFPALKGDFMSQEIEKWTSKKNYEIIADYHFGGYAKVDEALIDFINTFHHTHGVLLDPIYTAKMLYGVTDLIAKGYFPSKSRILAIHTGGLQGISGMNKRLMQKGLPTIQVA